LWQNLNIQPYCQRVNATVLIPNMAGKILLHLTVLKKTNDHLVYICKIKLCLVNVAEIEGTGCVLCENMFFFKEWKFVLI